MNTDTAHCQTRIKGSKAKGYTAVCDCGWRHLGTYVMDRAGMEREVAAHRILKERVANFDRLDAGEITKEEWKIAADEIAVRLQAARMRGTR